MFSGVNTEKKMPHLKFVLLLSYQADRHIRKSIKHIYNCKAHKRICFRYMDSTIPHLLMFKIFKAIVCFGDCTEWFVSDLVRNPD